MCTLTIVPLGSGYRLVVNRDELRARVSASAPRVTRVSGRSCVWPVDGKEGGTWIAVSDAGVSMSVQNVNPDPRPALPRGIVSRGHIIPPMMGVGSASEALVALENLDLETFAPFRLVALDARSILEARWNREALSITRRPMQAVCFTTSGLGDHLVTERLTLFDSFVRDRGATREMQDAYHAHRWADRPEISVHMARADARTVSVTRVEVTRAERGSLVEMEYSDDGGTARASVGAERAAGGAPAGGAPAGGVAAAIDGRAAW